jgi:hypothetical protein
MKYMNRSRLRRKSSMKLIDQVKLLLFFFLPYDFHHEFVCQAICHFFD